MDRHFKRRQYAHCGSKKYAWYLRVDSMAWAMPMPDHLFYPAGRTHQFHNRDLTSPAISPPKNKEFQRCGVPLGCLKVVPTEIAGSGDDNARISATSQGREDKSSSHDLVSGLKGSLDCVARVLALSTTSEKRQLLCDRKEPFAHLTPRRLALTLIKSSIVTGAPLLNEAILESLDEEDSPSGSSNESRARQGGDGLSGFMLNDSISRVFVDGRGNILRTGQQEFEGDDRDDDTDLMKTLAKSFKNFPALVLRRVLHNVMSVSTQRILEWQAVVHLSTRSADRLTKNIALSALRKTKRMSRGAAAAKMFLTAGRALFFQNLAVFIVDELFVAVRLGFEERNRRKNKPYASTDWEALLREMKEKTYGNAVFAVSMWAAGTLGAMVGTLVYPKRGPDLLSTLGELGASALLN